MLSEERINEIVVVYEEHIAATDEFFNLSELKTNESVEAWNLKLKQIKSQVSDVEWKEFFRLLGEIWREIKEKN